MTAALIFSKINSGAEILDIGFQIAWILFDAHTVSINEKYCNI